ncbi:MAG: ABC transporter ATP-binding protein [Marinilabiliales bacterium]|nr:MAG: ABC transporter ATP-binding protein [Marinilabiliales bacterium]
MKEQENIIHISNLEIGYPIKGNINNTLFNNINLAGSSGELIALVGKNGIGKSTLLRNISGLQEPLKGQINYFGKLKNSYSRTDFARMVSFVSTEIVNVNNLSVFDLVSLGRFPHTNWLGKLKPEDVNRTARALEMVGMSSFSRKHINEISDGERQRVMIARTLAQDSKIIVLDEPTAFLDLPNKYEIIHLLNKLSKEENKTIIFSTHDLNIAIQEADKIWLMLEDKIAEGAPEDLILNETFNRIFEKSNLKFDKLKGDFKMQKSHHRKIGIYGDGPHFVWTKKALERLNFMVVKENESGQYIKIEKENNLCKWTLIEDKNIKEFSSIYDLSIHLKLQLKN